MITISLFILLFIHLKNKKMKYKTANRANRVQDLEENEDDFEKIDLNIWKKIFKIIIKDKKIIVQMMIAVVFLAIS